MYSYDYFEPYTMTIENQSDYPVSQQKSLLEQESKYTPRVLNDAQKQDRSNEERASAEEASELLLAMNQRTQEPKLDNVFHPRGKISFYGTRKDGFGFDSGKMITASGATFKPMENVAAHMGLPFGTEVRVTNPENQKSVVVKVIDRGPSVADREFDLSYGAFKTIADPKKGVIDAVFTIVSKPKPRKA